jgi:hypothetical protein
MALSGMESAIFLLGQLFLSQLRYRMSLSTI